MRATLTLVLALGATPAFAMTPNADLETSPLKPLCERICGGVWASTTPPAPDQFVTTYSYAWDEALRGIRGTVTTTGGIAGVHEEIIAVYGFDAKAGKFWVTRIDGDGPPIYGDVELSDDGYRETVSPVNDLGSQMISSYKFSGADEYMVTSEILAKGQATMGTPETYRREKR